MSGLYASAATTTTNPDPNSLATPNPFGTPYRVNYDININPAWIAQGNKALIPSGSYEAGRSIQGSIRFKPSSAHATYTIATWVWDTTFHAWFLASMLESTRLLPNTEDSYYASYPPGALHPTVANNFQDTLIWPMIDPIYIEVKALSAGSLAIYFDSGVFTAI